MARKQKIRIRMLVEVDVEMAGGRKVTEEDQLDESYSAGMDMEPVIEQAISDMDIDSVSKILNVNAHISTVTKV